MGDSLEHYLCSPRKIRKLGFGSQNTQTSTPDGRKFSSQESQQSRATSTPTKVAPEKNLSISTDLSSIYDQPTQSEKSVLSEDDTISCTRSKSEELSLRSSPSSYTSSSKCYSLDLLRAPNRRLFKGKLWKFFEPKVEGSLYFKIFTDFDSIQEYALDLLNEFRTNKREATLSLIKFFVDVCGYQRAKIEKHFNFDEDFNISSKKLIKLMELELVEQELLDNKTYIFYESEKEKSKLGATLAMAVQNFMQEFFVGAYAMDMLFSEALYLHVFNFLYHMCLSILRPIRHTGVVLVRNLLMIFNSIFDRILKNIDGERNLESDNENCSSKKERKYMERYLNYFFQLFAKNSFIPDPHLAVLRAKNVKEMGTWAIDTPQMYFEKCFGILLKLSIDESETVRMSVLEAFESFLKKKSTHLYITRNIASMTKTVSDRFKDVSIKVVTRAVNIFTVLLDNYRQFIGEDHVFQISELLYGNSYLYAKAAGFFLSKLFTFAFPNDNELLHKLVDMSTVAKFSKMKPLLIEGFSECETILKNYDFLVNYLTTCSHDESSEFSNNLMELIYYSVYQTLKGESVIRRKHSVQVCSIASHHESIAKIFLSNLKNLFELYRNETIALNYLIKILCLIDFDVLLTSSYHWHYLFMMKNCRQFFLNRDDDELLENICKLFNYLCYDKNISLNENMKNKFLDNLFENMSVYLKGYLEPEDPEISLDVHFNKIGKLYEQFNLNKYFHWNDLFVNWGNVVLCEGQIIACTQFLIWSIEDLARETDKGSDALRMQSLYFKNIFSEYTKSLVSVMQSTNTENDMKYKAFNSLCRLHTSSDRILLKEGQLDGLRFDIMENLRKDFCKSLTQFFKKKIVYNRSLSLETRKKYISSWINLSLNGIIDLLYLVPLFECYYTRSQEYESLINFVADKIFAKNQQAFFNIILATLGELADEVFGTEKKSVSSPEAVELTELSAKFANMQQFGKFSEEVLRLIHLGIRFAFKAEMLEFFVLLQNFSPNHWDDRKQCSDILEELTPPDYENHKYVKAFRMKLKSEKLRVRKKVGTIGEETSASVTSISKEESEENIEPTVKKQRRSSKSKEYSKQLDTKTKSEKASNKKGPKASKKNDDKENIPVKSKSQKNRSRRNEVKNATKSKYSTPKDGK